MKMILIISSLLLTASCASLLQERTFIKEMDKNSDGMWTPHEDFHVISGDKRDGYRSREQITARTPDGRKYMRFSDSLLEELSRKEKSMTMEQYADYSELKPDLETTSEKIYYLNLTEEDRDLYLSSRQLGKYSATNRRARRPSSIINRSRYQKNNKRTRMPIANRISRGHNIYQGMAKDEVRQSWGRPLRVEVAGNPGNQNEKWTFYENGKLKQVFFESGVVEGWALE